MKNVLSKEEYENFLKENGIKSDTKEAQEVYKKIRKIAEKHYENKSVRPLKISLDE